MRHYFSYNGQGEIIASHLWFGGFPDDACLEDGAECSHPAVQGVLGHANGNLPGRVGFALYECECPAERGYCGCARLAKESGYVVDGTLVINPGAEVWVGGVKVDPTSVDAPLVLPPLSREGVVFKLPGDESNGFEAVVAASLSPGMTPLSLSLPQTVEIVDRQTPEISIIVPSHGQKGGLIVRGPRIATTRFYVMGFITE